MRVAFSEAPNSDPTHDGAAGETARTVTWTLVDSTNTSSTATTALDTVHKAPVLTAGVTATFSEGQTGPTVLDSGLTLTDSDPIASATVSVSGFASGDDLAVRHGDGRDARRGDDHDGRRRHGGHRDADLWGRHDHGDVRRDGGHADA